MFQQTIVFSCFINLPACRLCMLIRLIAACNVALMIKIQNSKPVFYYTL